MVKPCDHIEDLDNVREAGAQKQMDVVERWKSLSPSVARASAVTGRCDVTTRHTHHADDPRSFGAVLESGWNSFEVCYRLFFFEQ